MKRFEIFGRAGLVGILTVFALVTAAPFAFSSDHIDGPVSIKNQVADIVDLYAFPTPGTPGVLTLILDVYPFVSSTNHFSDRVDYNFILRKAALAPDGSRIVTDPASEVVINCRFITPQQVADTQMICSSKEAQPRVMGQIRFNEIQQPKVGNNIMLFAGRRADPFFLSKDFAASYMDFKNGKPDGNNVMNNLNCLSVVINVSINQLFPPGAVAATKTPANKNAAKDPNRKVAQVESFMIAVGAESVTYDRALMPPRRIDRVGRPEVTNVSMNMSKSQPEVRDSFNSDRPFEVNGKMQSYVTRLQNNMDRYDKMDAHQDWSPTDLNRLATIIADDYLVVDPFMPCQHSSFFEIEAAVLMGQPHQSCGGRDLNDNVVNKLYTLYEKGPRAMPSMVINDGLKGPSKPVSNIFPFEAEPYDGIVEWLTREIANTAKNFL